MVPWILISIAVVIVLLAVIALLFNKKGKEHKIDYHNFFTIGVVWITIGIPLMVTTHNFALLMMGIIFMITGLVHKKEWKKNIADRKRRMKNRTKKEKKFLFIVKVISLLVLLLGVLAFILFAA